jgi:hypothetical protein
MAPPVMPDDAERYGKHSRAHARGLGVAELLRRVVARGEAVRLAWRGDEATSALGRSGDFPTAILPVVRDEYPDENDEDTQPSTATREARRWLQPPGFSLWPNPLTS